MNLNHLLSAALKSRHDEDLVDKWNNKLTAYLMFAFGLSIFAQEYTGDPLKCWQKPSWKDHWLEYVEDYCFVEGTYAIKLNESLPKHLEDYDFQQKVTFYQWIPFIFYLMGFLLQLPRFFWSFINWTSYLHLTGFCNVAVTSFRHHAVHKHRDIEIFVTHLEDAIERKCKKSKAKKNFTPRKNYIVKATGYWDNHVSPKYLTISYLFLKIWQILNPLLLLIILNRLIADQWTGDLFGYETITKLISGHAWTETGLFPRVTVCHFKIREMGKNDETEVADKTSQCVLAAHMFVEKFFIIVWFWLVVLCAVNAVIFVLWCLRFTRCWANQFLKDCVIAGVEYVDFLKLEKERHQKEAEEIHKEAAKLTIDKALGKINLAKQNDAKAAAQKNKPIILNQTVVDMDSAEKDDDETEKPFSKEEHKKKVEKLEERIEIFEKSGGKMTKAEKKRFEKAEKLFYEKNIEKFVPRFQKMIGLDGLLTLYMISLNASTSVAGRIISQFFYDSLKKAQEIDESNVHDFAPGYEGFEKSPATPKTTSTFADFDSSKKAIEDTAVFEGFDAF